MVNVTCTGRAGGSVEGGGGECSTLLMSRRQQQGKAVWCRAAAPARGRRGRCRGRRGGSAAPRRPAAAARGTPRTAAAPPASARRTPALTSTTACFPDKHLSQMSCRPELVDRSMEAAVVQRIAAADRPARGIHGLRQQFASNDAPRSGMRDSSGRWCRRCGRRAAAAAASAAAAAAAVASSQTCGVNEQTHFSRDSHVKYAHHSMTHVLPAAQLFHRNGGVNCCRASACSHSKHY